jgi:hypothetical protein
VFTAILFIVISPIVGVAGLLEVVFPYKLIAFQARLTFRISSITGSDPYNPFPFSERLYTPLHEWLQGPREGLWDRMRDEPRSFPRMAWMFRFQGAFMVVWAIGAMAAAIATISN